VGDSPRVHRHSLWLIFTNIHTLTGGCLWTDGMRRLHHRRHICWQKFLSIHKYLHVHRWMIDMFADICRDSDWYSQISTCSQVDEYEPHEMQRLHHRRHTYSQTFADLNIHKSPHMHRWMTDMLINIYRSFTTIHTLTGGWLTCWQTFADLSQLSTHSQVDDNEPDGMRRLHHCGHRALSRCHQYLQLHDDVNGRWWRGVNEDWCS